MNLYRSKMIYRAVPIIVIISVIFFSLPLPVQFIIIDYKSGKLLYSDDVNPDDKFTISYIHSVNRSPVEDHFIIGSDFEIQLQKSIFKSFGAGIPSNINDGGRFEFYKDRIELTDINRNIGNLLLTPGFSSDHRFMMNGKNILLNELTEPHRIICFKIERKSLYGYLVNKIK